MRANRHEEIGKEMEKLLLMNFFLQSNPYYFLPWLYLTVKGLLFVQTDNLITLLTDMSNLTNYTYGFCLEDTKWMIFYLTIFLLCRKNNFYYF